MTKSVLLEQYQALVKRGDIQSDASQLKALELLEGIYQRVQRKVKSSWWPLSKEVSTKGLYLWGNVGTGKTYVMDLFYEALTVPKMRLHFHRFMKMVHEQLKTFEHKKNPLNLLAKQIAGQAKVICFDEFVVTNIVDAMILGRLLEALFDQGIVFVATSNTAPDDLYKGGLQRELFLPAIEFIKTYTTVMSMDSEEDYRLKKEDITEVFLSPINDENEKRFADYLHAHDIVLSDVELDLVGRKVIALGASTSSVYFDFKVLCETDRSQLDYIAIAEQYDTVFVRGLPKISREKHNYISRWISLIDVLYDSKTQLICLSEVPIAEIYTEGEYSKSYERTLSRLYEMQSADYSAI